MCIHLTVASHAPTTFCSSAASLNSLPTDNQRARSCIVKAFRNNQSASRLNFSSASASAPSSSSKDATKITTAVFPSFSSGDRIAVDSPDFLFNVLANAAEEQRRREERSTFVAHTIEEAILECAVAECLSTFEYSAIVYKASFVITSDKLLRAKALSGEMSAIEVAREIKAIKDFKDAEMPRLMSSNLLSSGVHRDGVL